MRLLHTSDWHLGRSLHGFSLADDQSEAVEALVALADQYDVDVVIVAGDVFDRPVPPLESLRLLNSALERLHAAGRTVVLTSGNHDSGDRLGMYAALLREGVHVVGGLDCVGTPIRVDDDHGPVLVYPLPYLDPDAARDAFADGEPLPRSHAAVAEAALARIEADRADQPPHRAVVVGHAFVGAAAVEPSTMSSDSERDLSIGGVQMVPAELFAGRGISYVALGHLHRPQEIRPSDPTIGYSGSLLRYSLSEAGHAKSVTLVTLGAPGDDVAVERIPLPGGRAMARLSGTIDELLSDAHGVHRDDYVELIVTDPLYPERMHARLDEAFPFALRKEHRPAGVEPAAVGVRGDARGRDPIDVITSFFAKVTSQEPTAEQRDLLRSAYEQASRGG